MFPKNSYRFFSREKKELTLSHAASDVPGTVDATIFFARKKR
jgi:hypothetical protein